MARRRRNPKRARVAAAPAVAPEPSLGAREVAILALLFAALALAVYWPSLGGPFLSDDLHYVATNPYVHDLTLANVAAIFDPRSPATVFVVNYAPVQLLLHGIEWQFFGESTTGYHVVNVLLHALGSALLAALFVRAGLSRAAWAWPSMRSSGAVSALRSATWLIHTPAISAISARKRGSPRSES